MSTFEDWAPILILFGLIGLSAALVVLANWLGKRKRSASRGFEVKPITGETPVLREERDNDHG